MSRTITFTDEAHADVPGLDTGVSHAVALEVGAGTIGETFRLHRASPIVAFGRRDTIVPGYRDAVRAARAQGYEAIERLAGGRAAVFHDATLAFSWAIPADDPRTGVHERFRQLSDLLATAFRRLGADDATVGELPGEYCPGAYSIHVAGRHKVMGVGQRLVRGAAHVGGVIVVDGGDHIRDVLLPVYEALGVEWDPATAGSLADVLGPVDVRAVARAVRTELARRHDVVDGSLPARVVARGTELAPTHLAGPAGG